MSNHYPKNTVQVPTFNTYREQDAGKPLVLDVRNLGIDFGGLTAVDGFNITIGPTEISGLIGPNGAGKTTIFNLLTGVYQPTNGVVEFMGKPIVSAHPTGKMKKQYFQPMTMLELTCDLRPGQQLQRLKDVRLTAPASSICLCADKLAIALFVAEFLYYSLRSEQRNVTLYDYICDSLQWLDAANDGYANFHLTFLMRISRFLGFFPNLEDYHEGCVFDMRNSCFSMTVPMHHDFIAADDAALLQQLMRMNFATMRLFRMSRHERNRIAEVLVEYYRIHIPGFPMLKSLEVLQQLFD